MIYDLSGGYEKKPETSIERNNWLEVIQPGFPFVFQPAQINVTMGKAGD